MPRGAERLQTDPGDGRHGAAAGREGSGARVRPIGRRRADRREPPPRPRPARTRARCARPVDPVGVLALLAQEGAAASVEAATKQRRVPRCTCPGPAARAAASGADAVPALDNPGAHATPGVRELLEQAGFPSADPGPGPTQPGPGLPPLAGPGPDRAGRGAAQARAAPGRRARRGRPYSGRSASERPHVRREARAYFRDRRYECPDGPTLCSRSAGPDPPAAGCPAPRTGPCRSARRSLPRCRERAARRA